MHLNREVVGQTPSDSRLLPSLLCTDTQPMSSLADRTRTLRATGAKDFIGKNKCIEIFSWFFFFGKYTYCPEPYLSFCLAVVHRRDADPKSLGTD